MQDGGMEGNGSGDDGANGQGHGRRVELFPQQPTPIAASGLFELVGRLSLPRSW